MTPPSPDTPDAASGAASALRFIAGETLESAVEIARHINGGGHAVTIDFMGEVREPRATPAMPPPSSTGSSMPSAGTISGVPCRSISPISV